VANAIETFNVRLRNEGFTDGSVRSFFPSLPPVIGHAVTVKIRCSAPPAIGPDYLEKTEWWSHIIHAPEPRIVVIEDVDPNRGTGALVGEVHANILRALGCVAVVTNGAVRDLPAVEALGFPMFAARPAVSHAYAHIVELGTPVSVGKLKISPGDLLHADVHGVLSVPSDIARKIPAAAEKLARREQKIINECRSERLSIEALRAAVREARQPLE